MSRPLLTFAEFQAATASLPGNEAAAIFNCLPADWQEAAWADLADQEAERRHDDLVKLWMEEGDFGEPFPSRPPRTQAISGGDRDRISDRGHLRREVGGDPLRGIAPPIYFEALAGVGVPAQGGMVCCPLHDDHDPSCQVFPEVGRGWVCYAGCGGGTIIDLGSALSGLGTRGEEFKALRRWIAARLVGAPLEVAA